MIFYLCWERVKEFEKKKRKSVEEDHQEGFPMGIREQIYFLVVWFGASRLSGSISLIISYICEYPYYNHLILRFIWFESSYFGIDDYILFSCWFDLYLIISKLLQWIFVISASYMVFVIVWEILVLRLLLWKCLKHLDYDHKFMFHDNFCLINSNKLLHD